VTSNVADLEIGKAAEHLVVADLILTGYRAYLTEQGLPYDVVIDDRGKLYRVQVKATRGVKKLPQRGAVGVGYRYNVQKAGKGNKRLYADDEFEIVALVAIDIRVIAYLPFDRSVLQTINLRAPGHRPNPRTERTRTIDQFPIESALAVLGGRRPVLPPRPAVRSVVARQQGMLFESA
jgi:hypothetical protein